MKKEKKLDIYHRGHREHRVRVLKFKLIFSVTFVISGVRKYFFEIIKYAKVSLQRIRSFKKGTDLISLSLFAFILVALLLKLILIFRIPINQDEFHYLSLVHNYVNGTLTQPTQTFQVHFFLWLRSVSTNEVTQVIVARSFMYILFVWTCYFTYRIGTEFVSKTGALFSVLCYLCFSFVAFNGASFRSDAFATFLFLFSLYLIIVREDSKYGAIISGLAMALSVLITIKSLFHVLSILIIYLTLLAVSQERKYAIKQIVYFTFSLAIGYAGLLFFHTSSLTAPMVAGQTAAPVTAKLAGQTANFAAGSASKVIMLDHFFPRWPILKLSLQSNPIIWSLLFIGIIIYLSKIIKNSTINKELIMFSFLLPLATLAFYRNSFPYYYVFILSPAVIFCGISAQRILKISVLGGSLSSAALMVIVSFLMVINNFSYFILPAEYINRQREFLATVHRIFPSPVPYIDGCSMISSFPEAGFFMSSWGMEGYLARKRPVMKQKIIQKQPIFIVADVPHLDLALLRKEAVSATGLSLLEKDWEIISTNYIPHWDRLYVAGKQFKFDSEKHGQHFEMLLPGSYTLESDQVIVIDGIPIEPGKVIFLEKGDHSIAPTHAPGKAVLRWGDHLYRPKTDSSYAPLFLGKFC